MSDWLQRQTTQDRVRDVLVMIGAMLLLAALDFAMALLAKEYAERGLPLLAVVGVVNAIVLFLVYSRLLKTAELSVVTIGWVVFLQVGLVMLDRYRYGVEMSPSRWVAVVAIVALQAYLILDSGTGSTNSSAATVESTRTATTVGIAEAELRSSSVATRHSSVFEF